MMVCGMVVGIMFYVGNYMLCDFFRVIYLFLEKFVFMVMDFNNVKFIYVSFLIGVEGLIGIFMVLLMMIVFILVMCIFRKNGVKLLLFFNKLMGFNVFWYFYYFFVVVYMLFLIYGIFLFLVY